MLLIRGCCLRQGVLPGGLQGQAAGSEQAAVFSHKPGHWWGWEPNQN